MILSPSRTRDNNQQELSMAHALQDWLTFGLSPSLTSIVIAILLVLSLPVIQHIYLYRTRASTSLPAFLLVGPSGSGKTSLLSLVGASCLLILELH